MGELDNLDEMINDFNYLLFHQHMFGELNEYELAKLDILYNSPGMDLMFQDYCGILGLSNFHSFAINCICQYLVIFPVALIFEYIAWGDPETWVTFKASGFTALFNSSDWRMLVVLICLSLLTLFRPLTHYQAFMNLSLSQLLNTQIAQFLSFFLLGQVVSTSYMWAQITQVIGFSIVIFAHRGMIRAVEKDLLDRKIAQIIAIVKTKFEPTKQIA